jgi:DNA repair ATPase RecN
MCCPAPAGIRYSPGPVGFALFEGQGMLARLSIRDIVLIDRLDIDFVSGLSVLTGETGAGKSILLDAFALALGARGDVTLVRQGAEQGQVTAMFELPAKTSGALAAQRYRCR